MGLTPRPRAAPHTGIAALFALPILLLGCTSTVSVNPTVEGLAVPARLPLTMGIYYAPDFRTDEKSYRYAVIFPVGRGSVALLDQALPLLFERTVPVPPTAPLGLGLPVAATLEPAIEGFDYGRSGEVRPAFYWTEVTYGFVLRSPQGDLLASWTVTGAGKAEGPSVLAGAADAWGRALERAMRDAVQQFVATFHGVPEVRQWLQGINALRGSAGGRGED